jgi:hypothetical protein
MRPLRQRNRSHVNRQPSSDETDGGFFMSKRKSDSRAARSPSTAARWFPQKWDVAVSTANLAEWCQPSTRKEGSMITPAPDDKYDHQLTRRGIIIAAASLICAPAIVRVTSLMPVRCLPLPFVLNPLGEFYRRCFYHNLDSALRAGRSMSTVFSDGEIISAAEARRIGLLPVWLTPA